MVGIGHNPEQANTKLGRVSQSAKIDKPTQEHTGIPVGNYKTVKGEQPMACYIILARSASLNKLMIGLIYNSSYVILIRICTLIPHTEQKQQAKKPAGPLEAKELTCYNMDMYLVVISFSER